MKAFGFDFDHGRLDVSLHPFCGGTPDDVRITTRYDESDFASSLMAVLHETGHALVDLLDLPVPMSELAEEAADWEEPLAGFGKRYAEALSVDEPLSPEQRRARQGLLSRQLTVR